MHRETLEENSRLVDANEKLQMQVTGSREEMSVLKSKMQRQSAPSDESSPSLDSVGRGVKVTSAYIGSDGKVPTVCPVGGCSHYENVLRGADPMKNFQNHMNNTHRVVYFNSEWVKIYVDVAFRDFSASFVRDLFLRPRGSMRRIVLRTMGLSALPGEGRPSVKTIEG
jgi:hypothetical protein